MEDYVAIWGELESLRKGQKRLFAEVSQLRSMVDQLQIDANRFYATVAANEISATTEEVIKDAIRDQLDLLA